jgi:predicted NBD/HSP70 family sugar kinase
MNSPKYLGQNVSGVKARNIKAILMNLLFREPVYRVDLARDISVSTTTVTKLIDELIEQGIVRVGENEENGGRRVGRPKSALYLKKDACFAVSIHIGGRKYRIGIVNLRNEIIHSDLGSYEFSIPWKELLDEIYQKLVMLLEESRVDRQKIIGIGIGVPGLVDFSTGVIGYSKNHGWHDVPVKKYFSEKFDLPIVVENNVRAMALGEALFGFGRGVDNLMFLYGSRGVGAGLVVDRDIYRGRGQGAGEIGHTYINQSNDFDNIDECCSTLEELVSLSGILSRSRKLALQEPDSEFSQEIKNLDEDEMFKTVFQLAAEGNSQASALVKKTSQYLGLAIVNAINFINPELILFGGIYADQTDLILPTIRDMVDKLSFANIGEKVEIRATKFGQEAGLVGAGALALARFFYLPPDDFDSSRVHWSNS